MRRKRRVELSSIDQINMTPLIDLTFLLLIVFMITMPLVEYSTPVKAPEMESDSIPDKSNQIIVLKADNTIMLGKKSYTSFELSKYLIDLKAGNPETIILIKADKDCVYDKVIQLMKTIKESGFENVSLITI